MEQNCAKKDIYLSLRPFQPSDFHPSLSVSATYTNYLKYYFSLLRAFHGVEYNVNNRVKFT